MGMPNPVSRQLELHNTWLVRDQYIYGERFSLTCAKADGLKHYIDWATKQGFGIIDVNIPKYLPDVDVRIDQTFSDHFVLTDFIDDQWLLRRR